MSDDDYLTTTERQPLHPVARRRMCDWNLGGVKIIMSYLLQRYEDGATASQAANGMYFWNDCGGKVPEKAFSAALNFAIARTMEDETDFDKIWNEIEDKYPLESTSSEKINMLTVAKVLKTPVGKALEERRQQTGVTIKLDFWERSDCLHLSDEEFNTQAVQMIWCMAEFCSDCRFTRESREFDIVDQSVLENLQASPQHGSKDLQCDFPPGYLEMMAAAERALKDR